MEKRHRCKLCFRNFGNGRALGGHMRSHTINLGTDFHYISSTSSSSSSSEEEEAPALQDRESETEHSKKATFSRRSKRVPRLKMEGFFHEVRKKLRVGKNVSYENSSLSSISDTTPEEHVARSLIMLSRDKWTRAGSDDSESDKPRGRGKYRCEECKKVFKSYQALGGHRANHKKIRAAGPAVEKVYECPFCQRVFSSGQALGGHKRSHFIVQNTRKCEGLNIDLNLPAPVEDEEISSQVAVSDVC